MVFKRPARSHIHRLQFLRNDDDGDEELQGLQSTPSFPFSLPPNGEVVSAVSMVSISPQLFKMTKLRLREGKGSSRDFSGGPMGKTPCSLQGTWGQSLVKGNRSHMPQQRSGTAK